MDVLLHLVFLVAGTGLTWKGSDLLERSATRLSERYRLPDLVRGTLVVAVGSSFPELSTTVTSSLIHGEFTLGMATVVGSAVFNILVIPGLSGLFGRRLRFELRLVYRDAQFYLTSVAVLLIAFSFALIYRPIAGEGLVGELTRPIALIPLLLYGLYLFLQQQETEGVQVSGEAPRGAGTAGHGSGTTHGPAGKGGRVAKEAGGAEDGGTNDGGTKNGGAEDAPAGSAARDWLLLALSLALVVAGVEGLLRAAIWLGDTLGSPSFLWGATVIAAATSVPDALISVKGARRGEGDVSIGNVLGSNIFDLLVAIPAGVLVAGATPVDFAVAAPLMGFLTLATVALFAILRTRLELTRGESVVLLALYGAFLAWLGLETFGVTSWIG